MDMVSDGLYDPLKETYKIQTGRVSLTSCPLCR